MYLRWQRKKEKLIKASEILVNNSKLKPIPKPIPQKQVQLSSESDTEEEIIKSALVTRSTLKNILHGNELIPLSVALYLYEEYGVNPIFWADINDNYCRENKRLYISQKIGYRLLAESVIYGND